MAKIQWVNLPSDDDNFGDRVIYVDEQIKEVEEMGRIVYLEAEFDKKDIVGMATLSVVDPYGDNATYCPRKEFALTADLYDRAMVSDDGKARFKIELSAAGGDTFEFTAVDNHDNEIKLDKKYETHRKIFVQVIGMENVMDREAVKKVKDLSFMKSEFKDQKRNIDLEIISKGKTIDQLWNFNSNNNLQDINLRIDLKNKYDNSKDPFCFVLLWADCLANGPYPFTLSTVPASRAAFFARTFGLGETEKIIDFELPKGWQLWAMIDKSKHKEGWLHKAKFYPDEGGPAVDIKSDVNPDWDKVKVSTVNLPKGKKGNIVVTINVAKGFYGGFSRKKQNLIVIGTRGNYDKEFTEKQLKYVVIHETGHKLGMVPNGKDWLAEQPTHDTVHDPAKNKHCNKEDCVMWWQMSKCEDKFCSECQKSLRRTPLYAPYLDGFKRFY